MDTNKLRGHVADFAAERSTSLMGGDDLAAALQEATERIYELQQALKALEAAGAFANGHSAPTVTIDRAKFHKAVEYLRDVGERDDGWAGATALLALHFLGVDEVRPTTTGPFPLKQDAAS